jgi:tRNA-dihydrouridine synthase
MNRVGGKISPRRQVEGDHLIHQLGIDEGTIARGTNHDPWLITPGTLAEAIQDILQASPEAIDFALMCQIFERIVARMGGSGQHQAIHLLCALEAADLELENRLPQNGFQDFPGQSGGTHSGLEDG